MPNAIHYQLAAGVQATIQGLSLAGLASTAVYFRRLLTDRLLVPPYVVVAYQGLERDNGGLNGADEWAYPVPVAIVDGANTDYSASNTHLTWRQQIRNAFHGKRISGVTESTYCLVEPGPIVDPELWKNNLNASFLTVRCFTREART